MIRFGFLAKKLSRSFLEIPKGIISPKVFIDIKFANSKDLNLFINDIDINKYSLSKLAWSLKIAKDNPQKLHGETIKRLIQIRDKILMNLDRLDTQSIVNFCEYIGSSNLLDIGTKFSQEDKNKLVSLIAQLIANNSFDRCQILTIFENLAPKGFQIEKLLYEVRKIVDNKSALNLEEISQIIVGCGKFIHSSKSDFFNFCMERIFELSNNKEELDVRYLVKIIDPLAIITRKIYHIIYLEKFTKIIEATLPKWKENELLSIIKLYKNYYDEIDKNLYNIALERIYELLNKEQPIEFAIKLISLLKEETNRGKIIKETISKSIEIIKSKLPEKFVGVEILIDTLEVLKPIIDYQTANLLKNQINNKDIFFREKLKLFQKASWICVNNEGKLFPLTDFIFLHDYKHMKYSKSWDKFDRLYLTTTSRNINELDHIKEINNCILNDLNTWIASSDENAKKICIWINDKTYNSKFVKALKPLQDTIYMSLKRQIRSKYTLLHSIIFYECDPKKWENFVIENKKNLSEEGILTAIRFYQGPFEAIIDLLHFYENNFNIWWIAAAMKRVIEVQDTNVLNNFARILNTIDPHFLWKNNGIFSRNDCFNHLFLNSDFSLLTGLFAKSQKEIGLLPIDTIFSNNNLKILHYAAFLGVLDSNLADQIISNYALMRVTDRWSILTISSKCSDDKLREKVIKQIINDKLEPRFMLITIQRYTNHPENKEIDNYVIGVLKNIISNYENDSIIYLAKVFCYRYELNWNNHLELFNSMSSLTKDLVLKQLGFLNFKYLESLLDLADKNIDLDFAEIVWKNQQMREYNDDIECDQERLIGKIKSVGLFDKKAVLAVCNKNDRFSPAYLATTISCLADLSLEKEEWACEMAKKFIDYAENNKIVFETDLEYINWIYGLIRFNANKSVIMRHLNNSKYFEIEKPIFKHFLLANHFYMKKDYRDVDILERKVNPYWRDFNYFKHFGIDKPLINDIESLFKKEDIEVKVGKLIEGVWVPFYVPERKAALWPMTNSILLYKSTIFRGEFAMHQNQMLRNLENVIILNKEKTNDIQKIDIKKLLNS